MRPEKRGGAVSASSQAFPVSTKPARIDRFQARAFLWTVSVVTVCLLTSEGIVHAQTLRADWLEMLPWALLLTVANLLPVSGSYSTSLAADLPIAVAAALVLPPFETGIVAFLGAADPKEFHRAIAPDKALFNRSQVALADMAASLAGHALMKEAARPQLTLPLAFLVLATILATNAALVAPAIYFEQRVRVSSILKRLHP